MNTRLIQVVSVGGLLLTVVPAVLVFTGDITWSQHSTLMLLGAVIWFASAPFWMDSSEDTGSA